MSPVATIDLNCDMGESSLPAALTLEEAIMPYVSSVNIACGWHAGTPEIMRRLVVRAKTYGLHIGAHPGYRDLVGQGRRDRRVSPRDIDNLIAYQTGALAGTAALEGVRLSHVKPHGALYHRAARDREAADAVVRAVMAVDPALILFGLAGSALVRSAQDAGLRIVEEAYADRAYQADGTLMPRQRPDALLTEDQRVLEQVISVARDGYVRTPEGARLPIRAGTLCLHGDTPGAERLVKLIRHTLEHAGIRIAAPAGG